MNGTYTNRVQHVIFLHGWHFHPVQCKNQAYPAAQLKIRNVHSVLAGLGEDRTGQDCNRWVTTKAFPVYGGSNLTKATVVVVLPAAHSTELMSRVCMQSALINNL